MFEIEDKVMCHKCGKYPAEYNQTYCEFCLGISEEKKEETKTTTRESLEALGNTLAKYKSVTNGWGKSLKNKSSNEKDKKIEKLKPFQYLGNENNQSVINENFNRYFKEINNKINEIIDYIMEEK